MVNTLLLVVKSPFFPWLIPILNGKCLGFLGFSKAFALKGFSALPGEPLPPRLSDLPSSTAQPGEGLQIYDTQTHKYIITTITIIMMIVIINYHYQYYYYFHCGCYYRYSYYD